ncbi:MAG: protein-L-isoaspartate(D-aspartate) O-methyltransferase [Gemmatimonadota bacterium]|jgi:protein-L-isoaspartate(D-aspartate) O-methyltransferase
MADRRPDARTWMLESQLKGRGIADPVVLDAMASVPRELFLPSEQRHRAYEDRAVPLAEGQTVSQPYIVAAMTEAIGPRPGDRILEIGTGSGYQTAVLAHTGAEVYTVERLPRLAEDARARFRELGIANVHLRVADGTLGWPEESPFDGIVVTAAAPRVPEALKAQMNPDGGRLVIPVGSRDLQELVRYVREGNELRRQPLMGCRFVPLVGEEGWEG